VFALVDKLRSKKYAKTINSLCSGNKVFVKYQAQKGVLTPVPLRTPLCVQVCVLICLVQGWAINLTRGPFSGGHDWRKGVPSQ